MGLQVKLICFWVCLMAGLTMSFSSCKQKPKVIMEETSAPSGQAASTSETGIFSDAEGGAGTFPPATDEVHQVEVLEVLPTERYVYLRVSEDGKEYWVATGKKDFTVGEKYFYKSGIYKHNFKSAEYDRVFEELYLVSSIVPVNHSKAMASAAEEKPENWSSEKIAKLADVPGSVKIAELVANPQKYAGKEVQVSGICSKVNPNIMGRNWIHLKDGSKDDYDFVLTSTTLIPEGNAVTMKGVISVDKDFGAGYRYDVILEDAQIVH